MVKCKYWRILLSIDADRFLRTTGVATYEIITDYEPDFKPEASQAKEPTWKGECCCDVWVLL